MKEAGGGGLTFFKVQDADREKQQVIFPGELLDEFLQRGEGEEGRRGGVHLRSLGADAQGAAACCAA